MPTKNPSTSRSPPAAAPRGLGATWSRAGRSSRKKYKCPSPRLTNHEPHDLERQWSRLTKSLAYVCLCRCRQQAFAWHGACGISAQPPGDDYALEEESPRYRVRCHSGADASDARLGLHRQFSQGGGRPAVTHHNPPSYLADAFSDAGRRAWGPTAGTGGGREPTRRSRTTSTARRCGPGAGRLDAGRPRSGLPRRGTAAQGRNSSIASASGDSATANASFVGGGGSGGGGVVVAEPVGRGVAEPAEWAGGGADGLGAGDEASGSLLRIRGR